jgi:hypothetical protein
MYNKEAPGFRPAPRGLPCQNVILNQEMRVCTVLDDVAIGIYLGV